MRPETTRRNAKTTRLAFTLIELLVVIAIIALLIGILLPSLGSAREAARNVKCLSSQRQVVTSFLEYANDFKGKLPVSLYLYETKGSDNRSDYWYNDDRIGRYLPQMDDSDSIDVNGEISSVGGGVLACPSHPQGGRSYAMNYWAQSATSWSGQKTVGPTYKPGYGPSGRDNPVMGTAFDTTVDFSSKVMLTSEAWGLWALEKKRFPGEYSFFANASVGDAGTPGERFGGKNGPPFYTYYGNWTSITPPEFGNGRLKAYLPYYRHDRRDTQMALKGRANIGLMDGHVERFSVNELVDLSTDKSRYEVLWTPSDHKVERDL